MKRLVTGLCIFTLLGLTGSIANAQCTKDTDCKGKRICRNGVCTDPGPSTAPTVQPTQPAAPDPCAGITCSGHGTCVVQSGAPVCVCQSGYAIDASGLDCLATQQPTVVGPVVQPTPTPPPPVQPTAQPALPPAQPTGATAGPVQPPAQPAQTAVVGPPPPDTGGKVAPADSSRGTFMALGHVGFWLGVGALAFGGISTWRAAAHANDFCDTRDPEEKSSSSTWTGFMWAGYSAGAVLIAAGIVMWAVAPDEVPATAKADSPTLALTPLFNGRDFGLSLKGAW